jgi:flavin-dependent dehydrogenase
MRFDFGHAPDGFGWIFPKGDHLDIGLYSARPEPGFTKSDLAAYARSALGTGRVERIVGHRLGVGGEIGVPGRRRVLLAGDAAGMAERLLGEGIHNAITSGQAAAQAIIAGARRGADAQVAYRRGLRGIEADLRACAGLAKGFYGSERLGLALLRAFPAGQAVMRGCAAGKTLHEIVRTAAAFPLYPIRPNASVSEFERRFAGDDGAARLAS